jgi:hypothetical protein
MASLSPVAAKEPVSAFWPPPLAPLALCDSGSRRPRLARCRRLGHARPGHLSRARIHLHTTHSSRIDQAGFHSFLPSISARVISRRLAASQPSLPGHPGLSSVVHETQSLPSRRRVSLPSPRAEASVNFPAKESKRWFRDGKPGTRDARALRGAQRRQVRTGNSCCSERSRVPCHAEGTAKHKLLGDTISVAGEIPVGSGR